MHAADMIKYGAEREKLLKRILELEGVLEELVEVAECRGDTEPPRADIDPKPHTERMRTAWENAKRVLIDDIEYGE